MKPTDTGALVSEATVEEVHEFSLLNTQTGAAQMRAKYDLYSYIYRIELHNSYIFLHEKFNNSVIFLISGKC